MAEKSLLNVLYPGSGMVLDCIDVRSLPPFLLVLSYPRNQWGWG